MLNRVLGFRAGESFGEILRRNRGMGPGFDLLRILLASLLFLGHCRWQIGEPSLGYASGSPAAAQWIGITKPLKLAIVPAFFALSGFLVMASAFRLRAVSTFLAHRFLRIFPALVVEVLLSAFILGPAFTRLSLAEYFSNDTFFRYFGNMIGWISFKLPGVFENNPVKEIVNINLWTLPSEFDCYFITALLLLTGAVYNRKMFTIGFIIATLGLATVHFLTSWSNPNGPYPAHVITYYFFAGVLAYHYQDRVPALFSLFIVCCVLSYVAMTFDQLIYVAPLAITYCTVFVGVISVPKFKVISSGDYSYGMYLYGFPITQAYIYMFPRLTSHFALLVIVAWVTTGLFAAFSWHAIEKRCLALKKNLPSRLFPVPIRPLSNPMIQPSGTE